MSNPSTFVSCIKVNGIHLLPPVITPQLRVEIEKDRQQAIKLEKRLHNFRKLNQELKELLSLHSISDRPQSEKTCREKEQIKYLTTTPTRIPQLKKKVNLGKEIIDVSEYSNHGIKIISNFSTVSELLQGQPYSGSQAYDTDASSMKTDASSARTCEIAASTLGSRSSSSKDGVIGQLDLSNSSEIQTPSPQKSPKPRLIRSNSYTLMAPSPVLLAHLEKCTKETIKDAEQIEEPAFISKTWTSLENNYVPFEQSEFSSLNTVYNFNEKPQVSDKNVDIGDTVESEKDTNKETSPTIEVIQTDISVQQITVNANTEQIESVKNTLDLSDPHCQLMQVLKKIPENYSKQIVELIEKQRADHSNKVENFGKQFSKSLHCSTPLPEDEHRADHSSKVENFGKQFSKNLNFLTPLPEDEHRTYHSNKVENFGKQFSKNLNCSTPLPEDDKSSAASFSPSQSIYYSFGSSDTLTLMPNTPIMKSSDLEICEEQVPFSSNMENDLFERAGKEGQFQGENTCEENEVQGEFDRRVIINKVWAASVISAHIKGYLTRRLLKTERVQSLIDTIRDALLCALELHNIENIDEADIELHRRLITQVSAACYEFHDIFFSLTIPERMSIISVDRKRRANKAKRSKSGSDFRRSVSNSSRSSTRSVTSLTSSLTKI